MTSPRTRAYRDARHLCNLLLAVGALAWLGACSGGATATTAQTLDDVPAASVTHPSPTAAVTPAPLQALNPGAVYRIASVATDLDADISQASQLDGAPLIQYTPNGGTNQQWLVRGVEQGAFNLVNINSGKCLDAQAQSPVVGAALQQATCMAATLSQGWRFVGMGNAGYEIVGANSGLCLEAGDAASVAGGIHLENCNGQSPQLWRFTQLGGEAGPANYTSARSTAEVVALASSQLLGDIAGDVVDAQNLQPDAVAAFRAYITLAGRTGLGSAADLHAFAQAIEAQTGAFATGASAGTQLNYKSHLHALTDALASADVAVAVPASLPDRGGGTVPAASNDTGSALFLHDNSGRIVVRDTAMQQHYGWDAAVLSAMNTLAATTPDVFVQHIRFAGVDTQKADTYQVDLFVRDAWTTLTVDGAQGASDSGVATADNEIWGRIGEKAILAALGTGYGTTTKAGDAAAIMTMLTGLPSQHATMSPTACTAALQSFAAGHGAVLDTAAATGYYDANTGAYTRQIAPPANAVWLVGASSYAVIGITGTAPNRTVQLENAWNQRSSSVLGTFAVPESSLCKVFVGVNYLAP